MRLRRRPNLWLCGVLLLRSSNKTPHSQSFRGGYNRRNPGFKQGLFERYWSVRRGEGVPHIPPAHDMGQVIAMSNDQYDCIPL
jgi:hypothetical protein